MNILGSSPSRSRTPSYSGAKATAVQTLSRLPNATKPREASGLRRVHRRFWTLLLLTWVFKLSAASQTLSLPPRSPSALTGSQLATNAALLTTNLVEREAFIRAEILSGNVPSFLRKLCPVFLTDFGTSGVNLEIYVMPNYLAIGSDDDYRFMPMTPATAQCIADASGCILPTRKMVDVIYESAAVKLSPQPLTPGATMITPPVFFLHNDIVRTQLAAINKSPTALTAGHKKDVVITARLTNAPTKVAIYGWHRTNGVAIQPLYLGHTAAWVDYSHGIRLVAQAVLLNGQSTNITAILANTNLCHLLSDEGVITQPRYPTNFLSSAPSSTAPQTSNLRWPQDFTTSKHFGELMRELSLPDNVRVVINTPPVSDFATNKSLLLIFFALPNGNTIEQTIGKRRQPGDDWHFNIQHIGAQTRFLRNALTNQTIVVAYLENSLKSWPAWRRTNGNDRIPALFNAVRSIFADYRQEIVLTGHSGGGSLTFGYLNSVPEIPRDIKRIAFLDSNYAYETTNHLAKLVKWLKQADGKTGAPLTQPSVHLLPVGQGTNSPNQDSRLEPQNRSAAVSQTSRSNLASAATGFQHSRAPIQGEESEHYLCVLAYHDSIALLDGKTFVSERGGTWGRSHTMLADLQSGFPFTSRTNSAGLQSHVAANGRIQFFLKENPEKKVLHTVQVDRNGFIHAMLTGTPLENHGYEYFGARAYEPWIQAD
jgi:hypothetical protein